MVSQILLWFGPEGLANWPVMCFSFLKPTRFDLFLVEQKQTKTDSKSVKVGSNEEIYFKDVCLPVLVLSVSQVYWYLMVKTTMTKYLYP